MSTNLALARNLAVLCSALASAACGTEFDSISQLEGLRVMGVQKSQPFAAPGQDVEFSLLLHDTGIRDADAIAGEPRDVSLFWLSGCENPPSDLYSLCLEGFRQALGQVDVEGPVSELSPSEIAELSDTVSELGLGFGTGERFTMHVDEDLISRRPPSDEGGYVPYGLNHVFFAACAGELRLDFDGEFPVACFDERGRRARARDFIAGYSTVYSFEEFSNENPVVLGIEVDGERLSDEQVCIGTACETLEPDPERQCSEGVPTVRRCEDEEEGGCDSLDLRVLVDPDSVEDDGLLSYRQGSAVQEAMWVNYHTDRGSLGFDLALVNDVATGFNDDPSSEYLASEVAGPAHVWAVVRDSRGGIEWIRFEVCVEDR